MNESMLQQLSRPFHPSRISWKPGAVKGNRALAMAYADLRAYMDRLDEVCGLDWSVTFTPWDGDKIICNLTIGGVTRSSTGESTNESERSEIGGTVAEAQAFKRACAMFGLGRYLYNLPSTWADFDPQTRQFTEQAKTKLTNLLAQHYRRTVGPEGGAPDAARPQNGANVDAADNPFEDKARSAKRTPAPSPAAQTLDATGKQAFGNAWPQLQGWLVRRFTTARTPKKVRERLDALTDSEAQELAGYIRTNAEVYLKRWNSERQAVPA